MAYLTYLAYCSVAHLIWPLPPLQLICCYSSLAHSILATLTSLFLQPHTLPLHAWCISRLFLRYTVPSDGLVL